MILQTIRDKIDQLDTQVLGLLNERMRLVTEIGKLKRENGQSVFAPEREELLLQALEKVNAGPLGRVGLRAIYREILSASRANQCKLRIVYLWREHSNAFLAARLRFGASDCYRAEPDWDGAVKSLESNEADVAVIPRSVISEVMVKKSADQPFQRSLRICGEINLIREVESDCQITSGLKTWKGPEQFFILTSGAGRKISDAKSILLFVRAGTKKLGSEFEEVIAKHGGRIQSTQALLASGERFLCEVEGQLAWSALTEEITELWGRNSRLTHLGTYPRPHIYG